MQFGPFQGANKYIKIELINSLSSIWLRLTLEAKEGNIVVAMVDRLIFDEGTRWGRSRSHSGGTRAAQMMHSLAREDIRLLCEKVGHVRVRFFGMPGEEGKGRECAVLKATQ